MKRTMIVMSAVMMISSFVFAQKKDGHHRQRQGGLEKLKTELALDDQQYATIKGINQKYAEQFSQIRKDTVTSKSDRHTTLRALRDKRQTEINAVLTTQQKAKFETLKKERAEKRKATVKARGEERQAQLIKDLSLSDAQATKLKAANQAYVEKLKALRANTDKESTQAEIKKLRKDHQATLQSILTPEQFSKWKELRKSGKQKHKGKQKGGH